MSEKKQELGIKETKEFIVALGKLAILAKSTKDAGGITKNWLTSLMKIVEEFEVYLEGFKDLDVMLDELKDLDQTEVVEVIAALYQAASDLKEA